MTRNASISQSYQSTQVQLQSAAGILPRIEFLGSATSHFQAEPIVTDASGDVIVCSDWEHELARLRRGERSHIPRADLSDVPHLLAKRENYVECSKALGENMFRFSLDFPRLCPEIGEFNNELMSQYVALGAQFRLRGTEPFLTLHHFTMPVGLIRLNRNLDFVKGAWENEGATQHFRWYVRQVVGFLNNKDKVRKALDLTRLPEAEKERVLIDGIFRYVMTINEPAVILYSGYLKGTNPPFRSLAFRPLRRVLGNLVKAHDYARYELISALAYRGQPVQIGLGHNWQFFGGCGGGLIRTIQELCSDSFERNGSHSDFIGLHYYCRTDIPRLYPRNSRDYADHPSFGPIYPAGIKTVLARAAQKYPSKPIFISEFGFSDHTDRRRPYWIADTYFNVIEAMLTSQVPVRGMLLWTLVNNFEWEYGMSQRFGLFLERDMGVPPRGTNDSIQSWEVWRAILKANQERTPETSDDLRQHYLRAREQYVRAGGRDI